MIGFKAQTVVAEVLADLQIARPQYAVESIATRDIQRGRNGVAGMQLFVDVDAGTHNIHASFFGRGQTGICVFK